jgi:Insertion element 4 transposase N-terminal/Transposase DDE domain
MAGASLAVHGATSGWWSSTRGKVLSGVGAGVLSRLVTPGLVDEVLAEAGQVAAAEAAAAGAELARRRCRALPGRVGVYFVLGLWLFAAEPYQGVVRKLTSGLRGRLAAAGWQVPAATALTGVRRRVGERPLELLFWRLAGALTPVAAPWSHVCGRLVMAWDGTTIRAPASPANLAAFGVPGRKGPAACPRLRLVTLIAAGTRAVAGAATGPLGTGERALAAGLLGCLRPGMLLLADRGFYCFWLWRDAAATGADLLWRVKRSQQLTPARALGDGSWLAVIPDPAAVAARNDRNGKRRRRGSRLPPDTGPLPGITVRVIEFTVTITTSDGRARTEPYRLITTLLDPAAAPAAALAACYARRWAIEISYRELKICLHGPGRILRSRTPALARQELWAALIIYQAIRAIICTAAAGAGLDPARLSFTTALRAIRDTLPAARDHPADALAETEADLLASLVPERPGRVCIRAVTEPGSAFPSRPARTRPLPHQARYTLTITRPPQPPPHPRPPATTHPPNPARHPP